MIQIDQSWMEHEGGTKFYQVIEFRSENGVPVTLTHYGGLPKTADEKTSQRPINGGKTDIHRGAIGHSKRNDKIKRGYRIVESRRSKKGRFDPWWVEMFGATQAHELIMAMFGHSMGEIISPPNTEPDTSYLPADYVATVSRPANWGSW